MQNTALVLVCLLRVQLISDIIDLWDATASWSWTIRRCRSLQWKDGCYLPKFTV